jgi:3-oxoacyl-[acyl-carrier-protein] synthase II
VIAIVAFGAISALGEGDAAASSGRVGEPARTAIARDAELAAAGLQRPFAARAAIEGASDRARRLLERALLACAKDLDGARPGWRGRRVGLVLGTSSGEMHAAEEAFAALARGQRVEDPEAATYFAPMARAAPVLGLALDPCVLVLGACASSALAIGLGSRWLGRGACDLVLAGGFDAVTGFVGAGFEALRAITASSPPRPFGAGRDGMALGEGAAVLALERAGRAPARALITGFAATADGVHLTAPDREGAGLARAAGVALAEAGRPRVDLVSAHGTATPFNDAAEARALARVLGPAPDVVVHAFKAQIGHALGAGSALELLACVDAIARGVLPATCGAGVPDPDAAVRLLERAQAGAPIAALKLSAAFGGANAALVVTSSPGVVAPRGSRRAAYLHAGARVDRDLPVEALASRLGLPIDRVARADGLVRLALAAVARLEDAAGSLRGAGVVVGTMLATLETNAVFAARLRERGGLAAEPRRFPYTSPNAVAGECSIAFGLTGPSFSVGGGRHAGLEALAAAAVLVEAGDADRIVVVAVDDVGDTTRALWGDSIPRGAVAVLLSAEPAGARARIGDIRLARGGGTAASAAPAPGPGEAGHAVLLPLVAGPVPGHLESASPPDAHARVVLERI